MFIEAQMRIGIDRPARWYVEAKGNKFDLQDVGDFFRAWLLLERPYPEVKSALDALACEANATEPFPTWKVVASALASRSANYADLAVAWLPFLNDDDLIMLSEFLNEAQHAKWVRQHARHLARKFSKKASLLITRSESGTIQP